MVEIIISPTSLHTDTGIEQVSVFTSDLSGLVTLIHNVPLFMWSKNVNNDFLLWLKISTIHFSYPLMESADEIIDHKYYVG